MTNQGRFSQSVKTVLFYVIIHSAEEKFPKFPSPDGFIYKLHFLIINIQEISYYGCCCSFIITGCFPQGQPCNDELQ